MLVGLAWTLAAADAAQTPTPAQDVSAVARPDVRVRPDTVEIRPDTLEVRLDTLEAPADTLEVVTDTVEVELDLLREPPRDRPVLLPPGPPTGPGLTRVPIRAPHFTTAALLDRRPAVWRYDLGVPGAPDGLAFGATPPHRLSLRLDGRPADDLFTGRPAIERLPSDLLAALHAAPGLYGAPAGLDAYVRAYAADVPITELRYRAGPDDHQFIGVSHAQTRRPAFIERIGGERARLGVLMHVSGDRAGGEYINADLSGFQLVGRVTASLPGLAIEITERHLRRTEGAWGGVDPLAPDPFVRTAPVRDAFGERETIHNDLSMRVRSTVLPGLEPILAQVYWTAATHRHTSGTALEARGHRYGLALLQSVTAGDHRLVFEADLRAGHMVGGNAFPTGPTVIPPELHLTISDSLDLAGFHVVVAAGAHAGRDFTFPAVRLHVARAAGAFSAGMAAFAGGARLSPVERLGFGDRLTAEPFATERVLGVQADARLVVGHLALGASAEAQRRIRPRLLVLDDTLGGRFVTLDGGLTTLLGAVEVSVRADALRGVYSELWAAVQHVLEAGESPLHRREAQAVPELYGYGRIGVRGLGLFDGNLDVDLFLRGRAWADYRGRALDPATALLGLAPTGTPVVPGRAVLDAVVEAGMGGGRATVFVAYQNALAGNAYRGVFVVPVRPLPEPRLRIGVFWVLAD